MILLDVLNKNPDPIEKQKTPIWLMRQAGRYLPEYREVRKRAGSFLDLCYNPSLASEVTLQPIRRFDFDAAIIFSDILIVPHILGLSVTFVEGDGPKVETIYEDHDLSKLKVKEFKDSDKIKRVCEALELTRQNLDKTKALIGFAGSPWTVATYIISEKKHNFEFCRNFALNKRKLLSKLIEILTQQTIIYLKAQIDAGADVIQLFDSWSGVLSEDEFEAFVINPTKIIVSEIKKYSNVPIIGFPKGAGILYKKYVENVSVDAVSIDYFVPLNFAKEIQNSLVVQGNLDPLVMLSDKSLIEEKVGRIMSALSEKDFIFNLGHGIIKETPIENVEFLVDYVRNWKK